MLASDWVRRWKSCSICRTVSTDKALGELLGKSLLVELLFGESLVGESLEELLPMPSRPVK
jgi:hypothetical protein